LVFIDTTSATFLLPAVENSPPVDGLQIGKAACFRDCPLGTQFALPLAMLGSRRRLTLVSMAGLWLVSPQVQAESASEARTYSRYERGDTVVVADAVTEPDRHRVMLNLGLGSAVGEIGLAYTYAPLSFFQLETGVGLGFTSSIQSKRP
jgi:hypothetical protein